MSVAPGTPAAAPRSAAARTRIVRPWVLRGDIAFACVASALHGAFGPRSIAAQSPAAPAPVVRQALAAASAGTLPAFETEFGRQRDPRLAALARGTAARLSYRFSDASRLLQRAEGDTTRPDAITAHAALGRAAIEMQQFNLRAAVPLIARARAFAQRAQVPAIDAEALVMLVAIRQRLEGVAAAVATADTAAVRLTPADTALRIELACRAAQARIRAGDAQALPLARAAVREAELARRPRLEGLCWQTVGQSHQMQNQYHDAVIAFSRAAARYEASHDLAGLAASLQWRGFFFRILGVFDSSQTDYRNAIAAGMRAANRAPVAWSWLGLSGLSLAEGEPTRAAAEARVAISMMTEIGDRWGIASASGLAGRAAMRLGDLPRARQRLREAIARSDSLGALSDEISPGIDLIAVERELDGERRALARLAWVDTMARRTGMPGWSGQRWYHLGLLALRRGDGAAALADLERFQASFPPSDTRNDGFNLPSFDYAVRKAEAYALNGDALRGAQMLDGAIEQFAAWRNRLSQRGTRLAAWEERGLDPDPDLGIATIIARTAAAGHDTLALRLADARRARDIRTTLQRTARPVDLAPGQLLLQFVTGRHGEPTTVLMRSRTTLRSATLPPIDSLEHVIAAFQSLLAGGTEAPDLARTLGATLLGPGFAMIDTSVTTLLIVPDGALHGVPWSALALPSGQRVYDRFAVATLLSGLQPDRAPSRNTGAVVSLGVGEGSTVWDGVPLAALRHAPDEARAVAARSRGGVALIDGEATERAVRALTDHVPSILHVAAHAVVDDRSTARAAIVLRAGNGDDGLLEAREIAGMRLPLDLVVLSGCSTASGRVLAAEGLQGLVRPLLDAGVRSVIASHWPVRDDAAQQIMTWFYDALAEGRTGADALRRAQQRARAAGLPSGDWAGWRYVGDPSVRPSATIEAGARQHAVDPRIIGLVVTLLALAVMRSYCTTRRRVALRT